MVLSQQAVGVLTIWPQVLSPAGLVVVHPRTLCYSNISVISKTFAFTFIHWQWFSMATVKQPGWVSLVLMQNMLVTQRQHTTLSPLILHDLTSLDPPYSQLYRPLQKAIISEIWPMGRGIQIGLSCDPLQAYPQFKSFNRRSELE